MFRANLLCAPNTKVFDDAELIARVLGLTPICLDHSIEIRHEDIHFMQASINRIKQDTGLNRVSDIFDQNEKCHIDVSRGTSNSLVAFDLEQDPSSPVFVRYSGSYIYLRNCLIAIGRQDLIESIYKNIK